MIKQSQMKAILAKIQDDTSENFSTDLQILQDNLSIHIFNDPDVNIFQKISKESSEQQPAI